MAGSPGENRSKMRRAAARGKSLSNAARLKLHEAQGRVRELNRVATELAREVADASGRTVVVAGSMPSSGGVNLYCAVIVKTVDAQTRSKTGINELLRD